MVLHELVFVRLRIAFKMTLLESKGTQAFVDRIHGTLDVVYARNELK